jgi:hypothetical protein
MGFLHLFPLSTIGLPESVQLVAEILQGLFFLRQTTLGEFHLPLRLLPLSLRSAARHFPIGVAVVGIQVGPVHHLPDNALLVGPALPEADRHSTGGQMLRDTAAVNPRRIRISGPPHQHQTARVGLGLLRLFPAGVHRLVVWVVHDGFPFPQHLSPRCRRCCRRWGAPAR